MQGDFRVQPAYGKIIGFLVLFAISYLIQRYFTDTLIAGIAARLTVWHAKRGVR